MLKAEGLWERVAACNAPSARFVYRDAVTGGVVRAADLQARYGEPYTTVRRGDLARALLEALPGPAPQYSTGVIGVQLSEGRDLGALLDTWGVSFF